MWHYSLSSSRLAEVGDFESSDPNSSFGWSSCEKIKIKIKEDKHSRNINEGEKTRKSSQA